MNRTQGALCLATTAMLLLTACGADSDDDPQAAETTSVPTATPSGHPSEGSGDGDSEENAVFAAAELSDVAGNPIGTVTAAEAEGAVRLSAEVHSLAPGFRAIAVHEHGVCEVQSADQWGQIGNFNSAGAVVPGAVAEDPGVVEGEDDLAETPGEGAPDEQAPGEQSPNEPGPNEPGPEGQEPGGPQEQPGEGQQPGEPQGADDTGAAQLSVRPAGQLPGGGATGGAAPAQPEQPQEATEELVRAERAGSLPNLLINEDETGYLEVASNGLSEELLMEDDGTAVVIYAEADHHGNVPERYAPYGPDEGSLATGDAGPRMACGVLEAAD